MAHDGVPVLAACELDPASDFLTKQFCIADALITPRAWGQGPGVFGSTNATVCHESGLACDAELGDDRHISGPRR